MLGRPLQSGAARALLLIAVPTASPLALGAETLDWQKLAAKLVERMVLQPGESVLIVAASGRFDPLVHELRQRMVAAGAVDLGVVSVVPGRPAAWDSELVEGLEGKSRSEMVPLLGEVDLAVMMPEIAEPVPTAYVAMQDVLSNGHGRTVHFHWDGAYDLEGNALPVTADVDALYQRAILETDYRKLGTAQRRLELAMRGQTVRVTTPTGTDIRFAIGDRPVTCQDGDASAARLAGARNLIDREIEIPAGAVRVAPIETTVEGSIAFPPSEWRGQRVEDLVMHFEKGKMVSFEARAGRPAVVEELEAAGEAGRSFREFVLGLNPLLAIPEEGVPWIPYYGYGAGVVRLSLGDNSELGGEVEGGYVRWNFFPEATVIVGNEVWVRDGRLLR